MTGKTDNRGRLSDLMERRRTELGLRWKQVAEAGAISYEAIRAVRSGDSADLRAQTKHGIDVGLQWMPGSVQRILDGGEPAPVEILHREPVPPSARIPLIRPPMDAPSEAVFLEKLAVIHDRMAAAERSEARLAKIEGRRAMVPTGIDVFPDQPKDARHWDDHRADGIPPDEVAMLIAFGHLAVQRAEQDPGRAAG